MLHKIDHHTSLTAKREQRVRRKLVVTADRPRLNIFRSNRYLYAQVIDQGGKILAVSNSLMLKKAGKDKEKSSKIAEAKKVAEALVTNLQKQKITQLSFDRGAYKYHGRIKALAETLRTAGIKV